MTKTEKIKVRKVGKISVYLNKDTGKFFCEFGGKTFENETLRDLLRTVKRSSIKPFKGEFFVKQYDGINKAKGLREWIDDYSGKKQVCIIRIDSYGNETEAIVEPKALYPVNKINQALFEKHLRLKTKGWRIIREGETLRKKLVK